MEFPPPPPPERSKRLHNFTLPYLRWGQQRFLRCVKLPSSSSSSPSPDRANHGSPSLPGAGGGGESAQPKVSALGNGDAAAARPWNLRTRRAACNEPGGGDEPTTTTTTRMIITNEIGGVKRGGGDGSEKLKFSVCLLREEIEEDFTALIGKKPPRRPKKRPRLVQKQMNVLYYKLPSFFFMVLDQASYNNISPCPKFQTASFLSAKRTIMIFAESSHQRISFAGDLGQSDKALTIEQQPSGLVRRDTTLLDSDFEFHTSRSFDSSPADEIFADGMILPFQATSSMLKRRYKYELPPIVSSIPPPPPPPLPLPSPQQSRKYCQKETPVVETSSKSFWSFSRSSSLNCDIKKSLICSFPRLTRSISTGSVMNSKRAMLRDVDKHSSLRHGGAPRPQPDPSSCPPSSCCSSYQFRPQKQSGKNSCSSRGGSFRITPVIGGPSPSGLGSILRLSKDKKTKNTK
uniref:Uncharacterized protein n=2 Tax=Brassica oleracea var. oleracea TaxID=109376 RepID=A0A0D3CIZ0_BRAOL